MMRANNWFLDPKQVIHQGGYLSDGFVILLPRVGVVNFATAGIEVDGVYTLYSNKKATPVREHRFKPGSGLTLASIYEEKTKAYKSKHGQPVEWTQWERNGIRYGMVDGRLIAADARLIDRLLKAKYVIHAGAEDAALLILRKTGPYRIGQRVGILAPARIDPSGTVERAIITERNELVTKRFAARLARLQAGYPARATPPELQNEHKASTSPDTESDVQLIPAGAPSA